MISGSELFALVPVSNGIKRIWKGQTVVHSRSTEHILVVEPDPIMGESIRAALEYCGYTCESAVTAGAALDCLHRRMPDGIIADPGLPDCDGLELIPLFRVRSQVPIIVLSRRTEEAVKIAALDKGADDYVEKPFDPGELIARLRAKLRLFQNDQLEQSSGVSDSGQAAIVDLSRMERALLAALVNHHGATVSEQALIAAVWGPNAKATDTDLRVLVVKLRQKLDGQKQPLYVLRDAAGGYYVAGWVELPRRAGGAADVSHQKLDLVRQQLRQRSADLVAEEIIHGASTTEPSRKTLRR